MDLPGDHDSPSPLHPPQSSASETLKLVLPSGIVLLGVVHLHSHALGNWLGV